MTAATPIKIQLRFVDNFVPVHSAMAKIMGLTESIVFMRIYRWIETSNNPRDGHYWTYQSVRAIHEKLEYLSIATINRAIQRLEQEQYLFVTDKYNQKRYDRTRWFALNPVGLEKLRKALSAADYEGNIIDLRAAYPDVFQNETGHSDMYQSDTRSAQIDTTIPVISTVDSTDQKQKDSAPLSSVATSPESDQVSQLQSSAQPDPVIEPSVTEKADATDGERTTPHIPNSAQPLFPTAGQADEPEHAPERATSPVIDSAAIALHSDSSSAAMRDSSATTGPISDAPDAHAQTPADKPKRQRKPKTIDPEEQARKEAERAAFEDAKLAVCYTWHKNPLKDPGGWAWVTMMANFLTGKVGGKQHGTQWDRLKLDDTPLTPAKIAGFRLWWFDAERLGGMKDAMPIPTVLETLQRRVQEYLADGRIARFAEQGAAKLQEVRAEYERANARASGMPLPEEAPEPVSTSGDEFSPERLAIFEQMVARAAAKRSGGIEQREAA